MSHLVKLHPIIYIFFVFSLKNSPEKFFYPKQKGKDRVGTRYEVKGHRQSATRFKVREPEFGSGKLPLNISITLQRMETGNKYLMRNSSNVSSYLKRSTVLSCKMNKYTNSISNKL